MIAPYYADDRATLYGGDALAVLAALPSASVDAVITDPPYSSGGMFRGDRAGDVHTKYVRTDSVSGNALEAFSGDSRDQRSYGYWVALWLGECMRIVKPGGVAALFTDWRQLPATSDALQGGASFGVASFPGTSRTDGRSRAGGQTPASTSSGAPTARGN